MFGYRFLLLCLALSLVLAADADQAPTADPQSDPLPPGAVARIGADRWMHSFVGFAAFLPDGKTVVTVSDQNIRVWQYPSGKEIRRMKLPTPPPSDPAKKSLPDPFRVAFAKDRGIIAVNYFGMQVVHFFNIADGQPLPNLKLDRVPSGMVFSLDGQHLAFIDNGGIARIWDWASAKEIRSIGQPANKDFVRGLAYSPDGKRIATSHFETVQKKLVEPKGIIKLWSTTTGAQVGVIGPECVTDYFFNLKFTPDGKSLAFSSDNKVTVVDAQAGKPLTDLIAEQRIVGFNFSREGNKIYTGFSTGEVAEWDFRTSKLLRKFSGNQSMGLSGLSPDDQTLLLAGWRWGPQFFDLGTKEITRRTGHEDSLSWLQFLPDGKTLLSHTFYASSIQKWEALTGKNLGIFGVELPRGSIAVSPTSKTLAVAQDLSSVKVSSSVILVDAASRQELHKIALQKPEGIIELRFSPDGNTLAILQARSSKIDLYEVSTAKLTCTIHMVPQKSTSFLQSVVFSPDGKRLLWYDQRNSDRAAIYNTVTGKKVSDLPIPRRPKSEIWWGRQSIAYSPDGRCLIVDMNDATAALIELSTGKIRRTFGKQEIPVKPREDDTPFGTFPCLAFSPDGRLLAQSDYDHVIHIWDIYSGKELAAFKGHTLAVNAVVFSPDGKLVASASDDSTALVWDVSKLSRSEADGIP